MKTDLKNAVKNYKKSSIYDSINEALVNSIQAGATRIEVNFTSKSAEELFNREFVDSVTIKDNGDGLNEANRKSFLTYLSSHKKDKGCKGIGRLSYLKTFQKIHISSKQNHELVKFDFTTELSEDKLKPRPIDENVKETIIKLDCPLKDTNYDLEKAYSEIYNHLYPFLFLHEKDCEIVINQDKSITRNDVTDIENVKFEIANEVCGENQPIKFDLWYRFRKSEKEVLDDFLCINKRPTKRFSSKPLKLNLNKKDGCQITLFLESDWINNQSNEFHGIEIEDVENEVEDEQNLPGISPKENKDIWKEVKKHLSVEVEKLLNNEFPELKKENSDKINNLKEKYPHYADYIENSNVGFVDEKQVLDNAYKKAFSEEQKLESKNTSIEEVKKCVSNDLIRYILHRQKIIEKLQELKGTTIEKEVHNLFLEQGLDGTEARQVPLDKNNLWLLDDKFMSYSYIASEKAISTFLEKVGLEKNGSNDEMDIVLYSNDTEKKRVVMLEMKKLSANYKENGTGITQLFQYSSQLYDAGIKELYLYLIAEIDDKFKRVMISERGFNKVFSHEGEVYQRSYDDINAYIQIISPDAIIADAAARNKTFLDIIKKSKTSS